MPIFISIGSFVERGHLVAGFGRIAWVDAAELRFAASAPRLAVAEAELVARLNRDHAERIATAMRRRGQGDADWRIVGIDPEGVDLRHRGETARFDFAAPALTAAAAQHAFAALIA